MSKVTAAKTEDCSGEQSSRELDLHDEINRKLTQAKGICGAMVHINNIDSLIADSLWAAESLIEDAEKAVEELGEIYKARHCAA
jgi:hypothetical protein